MLGALTGKARVLWSLALKRTPDTAWGQGREAFSEKVAGAGELGIGKPAHTGTCLSVNGLAGFVPFWAIQRQLKS